MTAIDDEVVIADGANVWRCSRIDTDWGCGPPLSKRVAATVIRKVDRCGRLTLRLHNEEAEIVKVHQSMVINGTTFSNVCYLCRGPTDSPWSDSACSCLHCDACGANHGPDGDGLSIASTDELAAKYGDCRCGSCWSNVEDL